MDDKENYTSKDNNNTAIPITIMKIMIKQKMHKLYIQ